MHFSTKTFVAAALFGVLAGPAAAAPLTTFTQINTALPVENNYSSFDRNNSATWDSATQLLSWGGISNSNNSVRDFQYTGTTRFALNSITFAGHATYAAPTVQFTTTQQDLSVQLVTNGVTGQPQRFINLSNKPDPVVSGKTFPAGGTAIDKTFAYNGVGGNKVIASNSTFSFLFYEASDQIANAPDAYYDAPFTVTFLGTALIPTLSVVPATLNFTGRAGTGPVDNLSTAISNTGTDGSLLVGNAGAATGPFSGGNLSFSLEKTDAARLVSYGFTPLASTGGSANAVLSNGSVQISSTDGGNQALTLNGNTVGPTLQMSNDNGVAIDNGGTIVDFGNVRKGTSVTTQGGTGPLATNAFAQDLGNLTGLTIGATTSGNGFSFAPAISGQTLAGGGQSIRTDVTFNTADLDFGQLSQTLGIATDQDAAFGDTTKGKAFGYQAAATVVGPIYQMTDSGGNVIANSGLLVDFGKVRQGTSVSTAAESVGPKVSNIFDQDLGDPTTLTLVSTGSGNGFSFASGFSGSTVAGGTNSVNADVVFDTSGFSVGQRTQVLGVGTDQDAALGDTGAGTQFGYQVTGTVVGPDGTATDVASIFDFSGSNLPVQSSTDVRTGVIDLGDTMPWTAADLMIHNKLSACDASPSRNDALCGITIGAIAWEDLPATPLTGLNILLSEYFEVNRINRPDADVLAAGSDDTLDIRVAFNSAGLMPGTYGRTLVINTDVGAAFGDTTAGRQYRFEFTASVGETPEPATLLLLGSTLGLLMGARKRRHTRERDDSISGS